MAPTSRGHSIESDVDLLMFAIEHLVLLATVLFAFGVISPDDSESKDTRVRASIVATVLAGIGLASELMQWSIRIMLKIAGEPAEGLGVPRFILVCVLIMTGAPVIAGIALAIPKDDIDVARKVFTGCTGAAVITLIVMFIGELWLIG